ncbi:hypothetical protein [Thomasclavelia sp.]|uniref:hypothetical protein n=1 Tax=Thomasclavelia sp. TaxID=3025757 RepID=UPI0025FD9816|nr:hypothetical protein [Thomasclavelia sp.]
MKIDNFENCRISLKEASKDKHNKDAAKYMSLLENEVIDFDRIKGMYLSKLNPRPTDTQLSNDVLFKFNDEWFFIEFKNGIIDNRINAEVKVKLYDSLLMLLDLIDQTIEYSRKKINYILVFNEKTVDKRTISRQFDLDNYLDYNEIPSKNSPSFANIVSIMDDLAGHFGRAQFGLERYQHFLFQKVLTIPKYRFDNYIKQFFE